MTLERPRVKHMQVIYICKYIDSDIWIITSLYIAICIDGNILIGHKEIKT